MKSRFLVLAILLLAAFGLLATAYFLSIDRAPKKPNVVFLLLDALRYDRIGAERNGKPVAPFLSAMADEGRFFTQAYSPSSWTKPTMASMFTSRYMDAHGVYYSARFETPEKPTSDVLSSSFETLAEYLAAHGYDNVGVQTNANLVRPLGFAQGFDEDRYTFQNGWSADWVVDRALEGVANTQGPFHLYAHFMEPHAVYDPPPEYREFFGPLPDLTDTDRELLDPENFMAFFFDQLDVALGRKEHHALPQLSANGVEAVKMLYDGEIRYLDDQVRRLVTKLREEDPNTLFIISADHGEEFWERGGVGHGTTMYQELVHVPLWVFGPGIAPARVDKPVNLVGLLPTIADYLALPPRSHWQGTSWLSAAGGDIFSDTRGSYPEEGVNAEALIREGYKLILDHARGRTMLFQLADDPGERNDLAGRQPGRVREMSRALETHREVNLKLRGSVPQMEASELDEEMAERLQALGYGAAPVSAGPAGERASPNLLMIVVDGLSADALAAEENNQPVMPRLKAFSETAWNCVNAITPSTSVSAAAFSLMTGLSPESHGVVADSGTGSLPPVFPGALGDALKTGGKGYWQMAVIGSRDLFRRQSFYTIPGPRPFASKVIYAPAPETALNILRGEDPEHIPQAPFFLYVHCGAISSPGEDGAPAIPESLPRLDAHLGALLEQADSFQGETIVVVTATGGGQPVTDSRSAFARLRQGRIRVPLLLRIPGEPPRTITSPVTLEDVLPTLAPRLGLESNPRWSGSDLARPRPDESRAVFTQARFGEKVHVEAILLDDHKLIVDRTTGEITLFNLADDPHEMRNLAPEHEDLAARLNALLEEHHNKALGK